VIQLTDTADGVILSVWAQPRAKKDRIVGEYNGCLKVAVTAPPEGGRANEAIAEVIAEVLRVRRSAIEVVAGLTSRQKQVRVKGLSREAVVKLLAEP
jgi:uncharacterized protein (TIGR00251 family)